MSSNKDSKAKRPQYSVQIIVSVIVRISKMQKNSAITALLKSGKVDARIVKLKFSATMPINKKQNCVGIHKLKINREKKSNNHKQTKTVRYRNLWLGELTSLLEASFSIVCQR
jgi:hypothetical protein